LSHSFEDKILFLDVNLKICSGEKIAILGPNGCGKSTLLKIIMKRISPEIGEINFGKHNIIASYYEQNQAEALSLEEKHLSHLINFKKLPFIKKMRVSGTIAAFDLEIGNKKGYFNNIGKEIKSLAMEQGLFIRPLGNVIYLLPPLCITDDQLGKSYWIIRKILDNL